ncbi:MAG: type I glyceraldehyde-3-phosphate dehydrogenase [Desulfobacterales bacterium]
MDYRVAINGYGRIGRSILRALYESSRHKNIKIVAINELSDLKTIAHLTKYDTTHGRFPGFIETRDRGLYINNDYIDVSFFKEIDDLPWADLDIDVVYECTGSFTTRIKAEQHIKRGAKKVIFSSPAEKDVDATVVFGINEDKIKADHKIISNASCTTNCVVPVLKIIHDAFGVERGIITTIHSMMNDQPVIDAYHNRDLRLTRCAGQSIIPVETELAKGIDRILPELTGRLEAVSMRVPTINVSAMDITLVVKKNTSANQINQALRKATGGRLSDVLGYTEEPLASCDFNHDSRSSIVDGNQTRVSGSRLVKVLAWFDNEWGYANRMLDTTAALMKANQANVKSMRTEKTNPGL